MMGEAKYSLQTPVTIPLQQLHLTDAECSESQSPRLILN